MSFFALTAPGGLSETHDLQESLTALQKFVKTASPVVLSALWHIALALLIFFVGRWIIDRFLSRVALLDNKTRIDPGVAKFVRSLVRVGLWALLIYIIADFLGVPTASFVALLGSVGVTVGLALQGSLSNFAGGLIIMFLHPFKTGDYIKTAAEIEGTVTEIGLFYTTLRMADNKIITIPNGSLSGGNITNYNVLPVRRLSTTVGIAYEADAGRAIELLTELIHSRKPLVNPEKALVYIKELGESSVVLGLHYWVKTADYWDEAWSINRAIKETLDANGIAIPFNQLDVHLIRSFPHPAAGGKSPSPRLRRDVPPIPEKGQNTHENSQASCHHRCGMRRGGADQIPAAPAHSRPRVRAHPYAAGAAHRPSPPGADRNGGGFSHRHHAGAVRGAHHRTGRRS